MKYNGKELSELTDAEILEAKTALQKQLNDRETKLANDPKYEKKFKRFPPTVNPAFTQLQIELGNEILKRNIG